MATPGAGKNLQGQSRIGHFMAPKKSRPRIRVVSLAPNVTSILLALGAGRELLGVSKWCKDVARVGRRPRVGDCWQLDIADVMRLKPNLLIGSVPFAPVAVAQILAHPVPFLAINPRSLAGIFSDIRLLGRLMNRSSRAEKLVRQMQRAFEGVARLASRMPARPRPRVYSEAWPRPRISSPPWVAELIRIAGGEMVVPAGARVTDEQVARARPDVIVLAWTATGHRARVSAALQNPAWRNVPAVRHRRVVVISDELLNTPGPPLTRGIQKLFRALHPHMVPRREGSC
jgi:iron complex transport system substrate-binding protein